MIRIVKSVEWLSWVKCLAIIALAINPISAVADTCNDRILAKNPDNGDVFLNSSRNKLQKLDENKLLHIERDKEIEITYVIKSKSLTVYRAIGFLRKTRSSNEEAFHRNIRIYNNIVPGEERTSKKDFYKHHRDRNEVTKITRHFHVPYRFYLINSFQNLEDTSSFQGFFDDSSINFYGRIQRYKGMKTNIMCATTVFFSEIPAQGVVDKVYFRVINLSEENTIPNWHDFELTFEIKQ